MYGFLEGPEIINYSFRSSSTDTGAQKDGEVVTAFLFYLPACWATLYIGDSELSYGTSLYWRRALLPSFWPASDLALLLSNLGHSPGSTPMAVASLQGENLCLYFVGNLSKETKIKIKLRDNEITEQLVQATGNRPLCKPQGT